MRILVTIGASDGDFENKLAKKENSEENQINLIKKVNQKNRL